MSFARRVARLRSHPDIDMDDFGDPIANRPVFPLDNKKTINDLVGQELNFEYTGYSIAKSVERHKVSLSSEFIKSVFANATGSLPSACSFGLLKFKQVFIALHELTLLKDWPAHIKILDIAHDNKSDIPSSTLMSVSFEGATLFLSFNGIYVVESGIPDSYADAICANSKFHYIGYSEIYYSAADFEVAHKIINMLNAKALMPNGLTDFKQPTVELIAATRNGLMLQEVNMDNKRFTDETLRLHYGDEFPEFNSLLLKEFEGQNKGIVLLHGPPGGGKTFYIRHLVSELKDKNKRVIIIPKHVFAEIETPQFTAFMVETFVNEDVGGGAVFIIEDAESILKSRESGGIEMATLSTLLNLSDGILNDIFRIQVVCTFNTKLDNVDPALLRAGRLLARREFGPLSRDDSQKLIDSMKLEFKAEGNMTLSEIYNIQKSDTSKILTGVDVAIKKNPIGFR